MMEQDDGTAIKPNALYVLSREQRALICQWLKELRFPDGYASNIARCVNMQELRLFGMKSHDCHVFMQRLLPIAFRDFLIDEVWGPLTEISQVLGGEMRMRALSPKELKAAELYVLLNCEEVNPWIALFDYQVCSGLSEDQIQIKRQLEFIPWFKTTVRNGRYEVDSRLLPLVTGPVNNVRPRVSASASLPPPTLCTRRAPQLPPPIFRPEIRQSLGISPYFLVLEHLVNPKIPPLCWKFQICAVFFPLSVGLCLCGCEFSAFLNFFFSAAGFFFPC
ncbi:hypothetical protein SLEP1_g13208 [Rubroshorea leprosula]|uniref:Uncharacterized protein n=1 Tax=Rubroshorea leprosula TaxID=152421 RepID=A0AAV5IRH7_9ROSI|nr:hypothetical protein SLEP1_g13208 [Rubroshorea leprosula]